MTPELPDQLTQFGIEELHGRRTVTVRIEGNRLILVGENGTGKSTVANLLYYLLTQQWRRIKDYRFGVLEVVISGITIRVTHDEVESLVARQGVRFGHHFPPGLYRQVYNVFSQRLLVSDEPPDAELLRTISDELRIPPK